MGSKLEIKPTAAPKWGNTACQRVIDEPRVRPGDGANHLPNAEPLSKGNFSSSRGKATGDLTWRTIRNGRTKSYNLKARSPRSLQDHLSANTAWIKAVQSLFSNQ